MKNKISLIIPNYNHARYLPECLDSVLAQTYKADEIIIVDDGSTDHSIEVIQAYKKIAPEIVLLRNEKNYGVHHTFNVGIKAAKNELIAATAADDIIFPHFYEKAIALFDQNSELGLVCSDFAVFNDIKPYDYSPRKFGICDKPTIYRPTELINMLRKTSFFIASNASIYQKKLLLLYGGYNTKLLSLSDYYLNAQIAFRHPVGYIPESTSGVRLVSTSYGQSIRFAWRKRLGLMSYLMQLVTKEEEPKFRKSFIRSGYLSFNGYFMILFLILNPKYWLHLPYIAYKVILSKISRFSSS